MGDLLKPLQFIKGVSFSSTTIHCSHSPKQQKMTTKHIQINHLYNSWSSVESNLLLKQITIFMWLKNLLSSSDFCSRSLPHTYKKPDVFCGLRKTEGFVFLPVAHRHKWHGAKFLVIAMLANVRQLPTKVNVHSWFQF